jgi:hypothetical protein
LVLLVVVAICIFGNEARSTRLATA